VKRGVKEKRKERMGVSRKRMSGNKEKKEKVRGRPDRGKRAKFEPFSL